MSYKILLSFEFEEQRIKTVHCFPRNSPQNIVPINYKHLQYKGKGIRNSLKSYRPIPIHPCSAKILAKIICQSINTLFDDPEKLNESQHGFRNQRFTLNATLRITEGFKIAGDQRILTGAVFVDFESAFDLIQSTILIQKLQDLGNGKTAPAVYILLQK